MTSIAARALVASSLAVTLASVSQTALAQNAPTGSGANQGVLAYEKGVSDRTLGIVLLSLSGVVTTAAVVTYAVPYDRDEPWLHRSLLAPLAMTYGAIGIVVGTTFVIVGNKEMSDAKKAFAVLPTLAPSTAGLSMSGSF